MNSREQILQAVLQNQPPSMPLPDISMFGGDSGDTVARYVKVFNGIGGSAVVAADMDAVKALVNENFDAGLRRVTTIPELGGIAEIITDTAGPHAYEDVEVAIIRAHFAVAENGAVWLTDDLMGQRIIPYICQHLAVVVSAGSIVPTMHEAYDIIGAGDYSYGGFIAGPSKTADIEQSLVLGAHGPITMTVFILE